MPFFDHDRHAISHAITPCSLPSEDNFFLISASSKPLYLLTPHNLQTSFTRILSSHIDGNHGGEALGGEPHFTPGNCEWISGGSEGLALPCAEPLHTPLRESHGSYYAVKRNPRATDIIATILFALRHAKSIFGVYNYL